MAESILSPDGKWMWTGSEWIPAPPSPSQSANVNLQDSVVGGDINITQNNAEDIATAMVQALERMGPIPVMEAEQQEISSQYAKVKPPSAQTPPSTPPITPSEEYRQYMEEYRQAQRAFRYATPEQVRRVYIARSGLGQPGRAPAPTGPMTPQEQRFQQILSDPDQQTLDQY